MADGGNVEIYTYTHTNESTIIADNGKVFAYHRNRQSIGR